MQDYGLVSIITPNWNCANLILETIRSVKAQTYPNWEIIIVDDCSTDNSNKVVESYMAEDGRIRFLKNDKNFGAALSRNYALREAKGRWIAFLDSDDLWEPKKLEKQLRFMVENLYLSGKDSHKYRPGMNCNRIFWSPQVRDAELELTLNQKSEIILNR